LKVATENRMINVFGQREMELAAIKILDTYWETPFRPIDESIFTDDLEKAGLFYLRVNGWLVGVNGVVLTRNFWLRVHGR